MLRILLFIIIIYMVLRIALRLLLTESPAQKRARVYSQQDNERRKNARPKFEDVEDAEFEEIPKDSKKS
ncbi:hypothetical protein QLX67_01305 [Balneolaceae bacterium ANBcel3]|nr:hypothetical protein [Balneolaceae bacterium ANBcel3]